MPGPDDLQIQTPGEPLATMTPIAGAVADATASTATGDTTGGNTNANEGSTAAAQAPAYTAKHNGGGRWIVIDTNADQVDGKDVKIGDFVGTKDEALAEADRLTAGGEPLVLDPERLNDRAAQAPAASAAVADIDATTLKQAVMTPDGWLCPEPVVKE